MRIQSIKNEYIDVTFKPGDSLIDVCESGRNSVFIRTIKGLLGEMDECYYCQQKASSIIVAKDGKTFEINLGHKKSRIKESRTFGTRHSWELTYTLTKGELTESERKSLNNDPARYFVSDDNPAVPCEWGHFDYAVTNSVLDKLDDKLLTLCECEDVYTDDLDASQEILNAKQIAIARKKALLDFVDSFEGLDAGEGYRLQFNDKRLCAVFKGKMIPLENDMEVNNPTRRRLWLYDFLVANRLWQAIHAATGETTDAPIIVDFFHNGLPMDDRAELRYFVTELTKLGRQVFLVHSQDQCSGIEMLCDRTLTINYRWDF